MSLPSTETDSAVSGSVSLIFLVLSSLGFGEVSARKVKGGDGR
jgi:hypothetical protein